MTEELQTQVTDSKPTGGGLPSGQAETIPAVTATPEPTPEEQALTDLETASEEERPAKRAKFQERISEITAKRREAEEKARGLELRLAEERGRREVFERLGTSQPQIQAPELPQVPPPALPPRPDASQWTDADGYEDQDKKLEFLAEWKTNCALAERDHREAQQRQQHEVQALRDKAMAFLASVNTQYPDFADLTRTGPRPTDNVMAFILRTKNSEKVAYYLAKNSQEINRLNGMRAEDAAIAIGEISAEVGREVKPNKISEAPPPAPPPKGTETQTTFDPLKSSMEDYGRQHPACPPWMK